MYVLPLDGWYECGREVYLRRVQTKCKINAWTLNERRYLQNYTAHHSGSRMWKKGKRTSPLVTWQLTRRAGGVIHQTDLLKTQTHVATLQGYPPPRSHLSSRFGKFVTNFWLFLYIWGCKSEKRDKSIAIGKKRSWKREKVVGNFANTANGGLIESRLCRQLAVA